MKTTIISLLGFAASLAGSANAAIILSNDKIVTGTIIGTMYVIDTPSSEATNDVIPAGPDWAEDVSDGWQVLTGNRIRANSKNNTWEPDGSSSSNDISWFNGTVSFTFDLPDGTVINSIYASWQDQNSIGGAIYSHDEGVGTVEKSHEIAPDGGLVLSWIDSGSGTNNANFEQLFGGPITVTGGNGFTLTATANGVNNNAPFSDAVVLDVTPVPEPGSFVLLGVGVCGLLVTRRRA